MDAEADTDQSFENLIWEAMSESQALVAIIPETDPSASIAFELGAAKAWNKPIYAVASNLLSVGRRRQFPGIFQRAGQAATPARRSAGPGPGGE